MLRGVMFVSLTALATPLGNCIQTVRDGLPGQTVCTTLFAYGVSATVTNAQTGAAITNATLTLTDGNYVETMTVFPTGDYVGAGERDGTYTLTAQAPGSVTKTIENIVVTKDECHVKGVHVDVQLEPAP
jgi:hypothetical protein